MGPAQPPEGAFLVNVRIVVEVEMPGCDAGAARLYRRHWRTLLDTTLRWAVAHVAQEWPDGAQWRLKVDTECYERSET